MELCSPAIVYLFFSMVIVVVDFFSRQFNLAFGKLLVSLIITYLLDLLCKKGYEMISWLFVLLPFLYMIYIMVILFLSFKLMNTQQQMQQQQQQQMQQQQQQQMQQYPKVVHVNVVSSPTKPNNVYLIKTN